MKKLYDTTVCCICRKILCFVTMTKVVVRTNSDIRGHLLSGIGHRSVSNDVDGLEAIENKNNSLHNHNLKFNRLTQRVTSGLQ